MRRFLRFVTSGQWRMLASRPRLPMPEPRPNQAAPADGWRRALSRRSVSRRGSMHYGKIVSMNLATDLGELLHPRVLNSCAGLYRNGHYPQAAFEAMKQIELALREISLAPGKVYGQRLIKRVFGEGRGINLVVPLGPEYQIHAQKLFEGAFGYYRNDGAHHGEKVDQRICGRVLILASELLDLLGASERTISGIGGVEGLIEAGIFGSVEDFRRCLEFYDLGHYCPEEAFDGYWEALAYAGISEDQEKLFWDLGVIQCRQEIPPEGSRWEFLDVIELTILGRSLLKEVSSESAADRVKSQGSAG